MEAILAYINQFDGIKKEWITAFTEYMNKNHPEIVPIIWFRMPTYRIGTLFFAFSITKNHFVFHTNDIECMEILKTSFPEAIFGKRSVKLRYQRKEDTYILYNMIEYLVSKMEASILQITQKQIRGIEEVSRDKMSEMNKY